MKKVLGQSLSEYGLAAALVCIVGTGGLLAISNQVTAIAPELLDRIFGLSASATSSSTPSSGSSGSPGSETPTPTPSSTPGATGSVELTLADGTVLTLDSFAEDLTNSVETSGANGTTEMLLGNLESLISQLEGTQNLTSSQANLLRDLSNKGHKMADIERVIEGITTPDDLHNPITYDGTTYLSYFEFAYEKLGYSGSGSPAPWDSKYRDLFSPGGTSNYVARGETSDFIDLYIQADEAGALNDPAVEAVVSSLAAQVSKLSDLSENTLGDIYNGASPEDIQMLKAYYISNVNSSGICYTGGGSDSGVQCN